MTDYVHGYTSNETGRLRDQAATLMDILHGDTRFEAGETVLEVGCGVGAQTLWLARENPGIQLTAMDINADSLRQAQDVIRQAGIENVTFRHSDLYQLNPHERLYDHIFVCFVLEHLPDPLRALQHLKNCLKDGGALTVIEGDHGSFYCHPQSPAAQRLVQCLIDLQASAGGDAQIGRQLYPLLVQAGYQSPQVSCRTIYVDGSKPDLVDGFSKRTFIAMIEGVKERALDAGLVTQATWDQGIQDLYRATEPDGTFCYSFFKAKALKRTS